MLLDKVNEKDDCYDMVVSPRLGRTKSKEQYAFIFKKHRFKVKVTKTYPDPGDVFIREPFCFQFTTGCLMGIGPGGDASELRDLVSAMLDAR